MADWVSQLDFETFNFNLILETRDLVLIEL